MKTMTQLLLLSAILTQPLPAQPERHARIALTDDDDGRVEVWRRGDATPKFAGVAAIRQPVLQVIFAGSGWERETKEAVLSGLRAVTVPDGIEPLAVAGSRDLPMPSAVNDLGIHALLDRAVRDGSLALRSDNVIHVVLLSSSVRSTLGAHKAVIDYDSYHSRVHIDDLNVRYVVVPWHDDPAVLRDAAAGSTLRAVLNPDGE